MSTIYIQEPPTSGKILLETSVGDIDIELWSREAPKACRNFVQLCMEGYYDGTIFHRVVKGFIVQGGDPTGTGTGGESIYGRTFKDEFHTRLRFVRRGLVAMANVGKDDNGSQFFFTMASSPELQNKHTVFGKVAGDTLYNMLKLEDGLVDHNDRPHYPHKIVSTKVLLNPFTDIVPRILPTKDVEKGAENKTKSKGTKNFHLLSFGDEAEEDEEETNIVAKEYRGKSKSSHDLANDPNLSSLPAVKTKDDQHLDSDGENENAEKKLKKDEKVKKKPVTSQEEKDESDESDNEKKSKRKKIEEIKKEFKRLKKELVADKQKENNTEQNNDDATLPLQDEALVEYYESTRKYVETKKNIKAKKTTSHEEETIAMLEKFQAKLQSATAGRSEDDGEREIEEKKKEAAEEGENDENDDEGWLTHTLQFESNDRLAKDANVANEDTFEIHDPRNPINQRRREASKTVMHDKRRK